VELVRVILNLDSANFLVAKRFEAATPLITQAQFKYTVIFPTALSQTFTKNQVQSCTELTTGLLGIANVEAMNGPTSIPNPLSEKLF
jgi:hypothetical protein